MAIAIENPEAAAVDTAYAVDIRKLAAAATLCRKARPSRRTSHSHGPSAWYANVLILGAYMYGGDPFDTMVGVPLLAEYPSRAFAVPYDSITAAAKGRKGTAILRPGSITFDDGATFAWKDDAEAVATMQTTRIHGPGDETEWIVDYTGDAFRDAVATVAPSASKDESRPVLTGVYVDPSAGKWAATDSYRMMIADAPDAGGFDRFSDTGANISANALRIAAAVKGADYVQVSVGTRDSRYVNEYAEIMVGRQVDTVAAEPLAIIVTRLIEGQYPNFMALIPEGFTTSVDCDGDALRAALQSAASVARQNSPVLLTADSTRDYLAVQVRNGGDDPTGEWFVSCRYSGDTAGDMVIGANAVFLRDGAECVGGSVVTLNLISPLRPMLLTRPDAGTFDPRYVCMPIRVA